MQYAKAVNDPAFDRTFSAADVHARRPVRIDPKADTSRGVAKLSSPSHPPDTTRWLRRHRAVTERRPFPGMLRVLVTSRIRAGSSSHSADTFTPGVGRPSV